MQLPKETTTSAQAVALRGNRVWSALRTLGHARREHDQLSALLVSPAVRRALQPVALALPQSGAVFCVASARPAEGRTLVAATLSLMLSEKADKSVLLVDANVQAPRIHQLLGVPDSRGLAGCLREKRRLQDVVSPVDTLPVLPARLDEGPVVRLFRTAAAKRLLEKMRRLLGVPDSPGPDDGQREESHLQNAVSPAGTLHVLPAGQDENSARFFRTAAAKRLLGEIRQTYDLALVDLPPLTSTSEAAALCDWSDGTIMVVRANATPAPTVTKALEMINSRKLLGIVLNREQRELPRWLERLLSGGVSSLCKG